jgi:DNA-binding NtrC family response regulator
MNVHRATALWIRETAMERKDTILIVDDEATLRSVFSDLLTGQGYRCLTAATAVDALQMIEANVIELDLLVSDIRMPGELNGLDLANRMRELQPGVAIVLITGYAQQMEEAKARGYRVLEKPFRHFDLEAAVVEELRKRRSNQATDQDASVTSIEEARKAR